MSFTENLELRVIDNIDNFSDVFTQGNYNANKLEEKLGSYLDDMETLPELRTDVNTLSGTSETHTGQIAELNSDVDDLETATGNANTRILALERLNNNIDYDGQTVNGTLEKYVLSVNSVGNVITYDIGDGKYFHKDIGHVDINLTSALNISASESIVIESAAIYRQSIAPDIISPLSLHGCGNKTGVYGKYITFTGVNNSINTNQSSLSLYDNVPHIIVLTILRESVE